jgi:hypothetical protein
MENCRELNHVLDVQIRLIHQKIALAVQTNRNQLTSAGGNPSWEEELLSVCSSELLTALFQQLHPIN